MKTARGVGQRRRQEQPLRHVVGPSFAKARRISVSVTLSPRKRGIPVKEFVIIDIPIAAPGERHASMVRRR